MAEKISAVYKITNTITNDFYIGSSKNVKKRWWDHKCKSTWKNHPNNPMYLDMQNYGVDKFELQILEEIEIDQLKEAEQKFIETLNPTYNQVNANGLNVERKKNIIKNIIKNTRKNIIKLIKAKNLIKKLRINTITSFVFTTVKHLN